MGILFRPTIRSASGAPRTGLSDKIRVHHVAYLGALLLLIVLLFFVLAPLG